MGTKLVLRSYFNKNIHPSKFSYFLNKPQSAGEENLYALTALDFEFAILFYKDTHNWLHLPTVSTKFKDDDISLTLTLPDSVYLKNEFWGLDLMHYHTHTSSVEAVIVNALKQKYGAIPTYDLIGSALNAVPSNFDIDFFKQYTIEGAVVSPRGTFIMSNVQDLDGDTWINMAMRAIGENKHEFLQGFNHGMIQSIDSMRKSLSDKAQIEFRPRYNI